MDTYQTDPIISSRPPDQALQEGDHPGCRRHQLRCPGRASCSRSWGPNGAGKTTTISILTTTLAKTSGTVTVAGHDLDREATAVPLNIGIIFQNPSIDLHLSGEENIRLHAAISAAGIALLILTVAAGAFFVARQDGVSTALSFTKGVRGSGVPATQARTVPAFGAIDLTGSSSITVHVGARQTVVVHADDNLINLVTTRVRDGVLVVSERGSFSTKLPMSVDVTVPTLAAVGLVGSGTITAEGVTARTFTADLPGSGLLTVSGTAHRLDATLAGSGNMHLGDLTARSVTATVPGSGRIDVHATHTLNASIPGHGQIVYHGHPKTVNQTVNGAGVILRG